MKQEVWSIVESRLRIAEDAISAMRIAPTFNELADKWFVYLFSWKGIFTAFESAVELPAERTWWDGVKKERRKEPLLHFLYEARNSEEHGLIKSAEHAAFTGLYEVTPGRRVEIGAHGHPIDSETKLPLKLLMSQGPGAVLSIVRDRKGREVGPPLQFQGIDFPDFGPIPPAEAALNWISKQVQEAQRQFHLPKK